MTRRRGRRRAGPSTRLHGRPAHGGDPHEAEPRLFDDVDEPPPLGDIEAALDEAGPLMLLALASTMLEVVGPAGPALMLGDDDAGDDDPDLPSLPEMVEAFVGIDTVETTALLAAWAELVDDEMLAARMRREVTIRSHHLLPAWLTGLAPIHVHGAIELSHVLRDGDNVLLGVRTAAGDELTAVIYIDHNMGTVVKDAFVMDEPLGAALEQFVAVSDDDPDVTLRDLDLADARVRVDAAIERGAMTWPPFETDSWPASRPFVRWLLRHLPSDGVGYEPPEWTDDDRAELADRFFASPFGHDEDDADGRDLFESLLWFGCDYGPGDPLRWSPTAVEILLTDWLLRKIVADVAFLSRAPDLLRGFIRFSHAERGIRDELTAVTLDAVDVWEDEYQEAIRSPRPQGPAALLAGMGVPVGDGPFGADVPPWWNDTDYEESMRDALARAVGGAEQLRALDDAPLPDESFGWVIIPDDIHDRVDDVVALTDRCCDDLLDIEYRTACRRLLADVAAADPQIFRRRSRADTAAAAITWVIGKANGLFRTHETGVAVADVVGWFGISGSPSQRAATLLKALGIRTTGHATIDLGSPRYLVSDHRADLINRRDRLEAKGGAAAPVTAQRNRPADAVLAVGWFPQEHYAAAVERWPDLAQRWDADDYGSYVRDIQGQLIDLSRSSVGGPYLAPLDIDDLVAYAAQHGSDPGAAETRAAFADDVALHDHALSWPPGRNDRCWCGSGRKYKKCCDTVPADPARRETAAAYEFDVELVGTSPRVWRRFRLDATATFGDLHYAIQTACGWTNSHLFRFATSDNTAIAGSAFDGGFGDVEPAADAVPLARHFVSHDRCTYEYDFGDGWIHEVTLRDRVDGPVTYTRQLVDGARAFPPEDCGGLYGYQQCVAVAKGGRDPEGVREWLGGWKPDAFDRAQVARWFDR
ncbi:hypothetical protein BH23ACT10_BH23ACT10_21050 [soil metagenome]